MKYKERGNNHLMSSVRIKIDGKTRGFKMISPDQKDKDMGKNYMIKMPKRATVGSAGYDFFAPYDFILEPNESITIPTGIRAYMQEGEVLKIYPRSGLGFKYFARLANNVGIIDEDYFYSDNEGHIFIKIRNEGDRVLTIKQGEAVAQGIFQPFLIADDDDFTSGNIRNGGFGSTTKDN